MPSTYTPTAEDWLKYVRASGTEILDWIDGLAISDEQDADQLYTRLDDIRALLAEPTINSNANCYSDGRAVKTEVELSIKYGVTVVHVWHPIPNHERNQPREYKPFEADDGLYKRIVIRGPGVVDIVDALDAYG